MRAGTRVRDGSLWHLLLMRVPKVVHSQGGSWQLLNMSLVSPEVTELPMTTVTQAATQQSNIILEDTKTTD